MSKLDDILRPFIKDEDSEGVWEADKVWQLVNKEKEQIKDLFKQLIDESELIQISSGRYAGHWISKSSIERKVEEL